MVHTKKMFIKTYGCQMNVYDSDKIVKMMEREGYKQVDIPDTADLVLFLTCNIREKAAEKLYSELGRIRLKKEKHPSMIIAVGGCVSQAEGENVFKRAPYVDIVFGPGSYHKLPEFIAKTKTCDTSVNVSEKFACIVYIPENVTSSAFIAIQEGCDNFCTYCVVPHTRGREVSRKFDDIITEASRLAEEGALEVTLLGQNVDKYEYDGRKLEDLVKGVAKIETIKRIRFTTSHPAYITDGLLELFASEPKLQPYLHLPIQSGSDSILHKMNRGHTRDEYLEKISWVRKICPDIAIASDFIVGFPGETDQDFEDTMNVVRKVKYTSAYSFKYSPRPGTPAAKYSNQIDEAIKSDRLARLQALINQHQQEFNEKTVGKTVDVLIEGKGKKLGQLVGKSPYMQSVIVDTAENLIGKIIPVKITKASPNSVEGEVVI